MNWGDVSNGIGLASAFTNNKQLSELDNKINLINRTLNIQSAGALSLSELRQAYQRLYPLGTILQCNYAVYLTDIYGIGKGQIPWFLDSFPLSWLASDVDISVGSAESESFYAGSHQINYLTQQSNDTMDVTFIDTKNMDIANSFEMCRKLAFPKDGTVNEPIKYSFALTAVIFDKKRTLRVNQAVFGKKWLVAVKEANINLSSGGRSEIIKTQVTFQKMRPYELFGNH